MSVAVSNADPPATVGPGRGGVVNDFSITVATVNGSGSQTANNTLLRAIHKMGVPVSGKNIFPSNIQGLPTWFTIRVNRDGFLARCDETRILVAMNRATIQEDVRTLEPGGICLYPGEEEPVARRDDVTYYPMPVNELVQQSGAETRLRPYVANMVYVGTLAYLLGIGLAEIEEALAYNLNGKEKAVALNLGVAKAAYQRAAAQMAKTDPFRVERMDKTEGTFLITGNSAAALGAVFGGVQFVGWYPITPATSIVDNLSEYLPELRCDGEGRATYSIVQTEDELAAIGMVVGAGWAGARSMTSTSGPGLSLMAEFAGYSYFAEIPAVIWDVQRMGPATGLPTRVAQGDLLAAYTLGHGDGRHVCLIPASIAECFEFGGSALDLAERLQTLVIVLSDLDLGTNLWPARPFEYPDKPLDRGKVLSAEDLTRLNGAWQRYADADGDGIGYRTLPGTGHPAAGYFTRGTGHDEAAAYSERPEVWAANLARLAKKHDHARSIVPGPVTELTAHAEVGLVSYGSNDLAVQEARALLEGTGVPTSYLRVRALPLEQSLVEFIGNHERVYVVENNLDGQMHQLVQLHAPAVAGRLVSIAKCDGLPLTATWISGSVLAHEAKEKA
ncbi:2-oxoacid:acceptor oxidoreductase subunit alpha [Geomonas sp. Red32]|uniref:2-oxoacid:acceptor oxidoreductase subunit alpha n=1 Tax=Geomonas sp. Red32 TaxID=2912856 RepID=UPI00202CA75E|nr:2-oxoacid:acceptor oxidoreductase subunit alpha [Geomonas sp. Red32]MCM0080283.1 2-oxoacid:acceptor oxidoreductase subunit alpha [Geomonas sp. Red32]